MAAARTSSTGHRLPWMLQLLIDVALTPVVYFGLQGRFGLTLMQVSLISIAAGGVWTGLTLAVTRKVNAVSLSVIGGIAIGAALTGITGNPQFGVAKDSFYTGAFGTALLVSMLAARPLMFYLVRPFATQDNDPALVAEWNQSWSSPLFRRCMNVMTLVWGVGMLIEAASRIVLVMTVPLNTANALSPVLTGVALVTLMTWSGSYGRRAGEARERAESATQAPAESAA
ncbi:VC0807 family protein [Streptomyces sp. NPDC088725]|uniref:VC0807 family protein n=1 Tax=Streptomyces sp. NPDC088725 TaxID=3365873 RepID=UPI00380C8618